MWLILAQLGETIHGFRFIFKKKVILFTHKEITVLLMWFHNYGLVCINFLYQIFNPIIYLKLDFEISN